MWILNNIYNDERFCLVSHMSKYTIGRQNADLLIKSDTSISRLHATIHLTTGRDNGGVNIELEDSGSTFGTFHNKGISLGKVLKTRQRVKLKPNDVIRFGMQKSVWKVVEMNVITSTSCLTQFQQIELELCIKYLDGQITQDLSSTVNYLTMGEANITMKLLNALIAQNEIVNMDFWKDFVKAAKEKLSSLPKPENYRPVFGGDIDLNCKIQRSTLFTGYTFIFLFRKHLDTYGPIVQAAGGKAENLNTNTQKSFLIREKIIVVQYTPSTQEENTDSINRISDYLKSHSKRLIPEYEIGLAVIHCSLEVYCNPNYYSMTESVSESSCFKNAIPQSERHVQVDENSNTAMQYKIEIPVSKMPITSTPIDDSSASLESLDIMRVTESPKEYCNEKRKRIESNAAIKNFLLTDEEELSEISVFCPAKKRCLNSEIADLSDNIGKEDSISSTETLKFDTETVKEADCIKYNFSNFLQKTKTPALKLTTKQIDSISTKHKSNDTDKQKSLSKKRRIAILGESDNNDADNLFDFNECNDDNGNTKSTSKLNKDSDIESFVSREKQTADAAALQHRNSNANANVEFTVTKTKAKSMYSSIPKAKDLPSKVNISNWISCSEKGIKTEPNNTRPNAQKKAEHDTDTWEDTLKDAITISKMSPSNIRKHASTYIHQEGNGSVQDNENRTNFKTFVKKYQATQENRTQIELKLRVI